MARSSPSKGPRRIQDPRLELASRDEIEALQLLRLRSMLARAAATNPFYRKRWDAVGLDVDDVRTLADFRRLVPTVEKSDFVKDQEVAPPYGERMAHALTLGMPLEFYTTSGTSGQGVELHGQTAEELQGMIELYSLGLRWSGLSRGDMVALTLPITMFAGGRAEMQGAVGYGLGVLPVGNYDVERKLKIVEQFRPQGLFGSTSYFAHMAAHHNDPGSLGVRTLLTGLEGVGFTYLERLQEDWNATAYDRFGCAQARADFMFNCETGVGTAARPGLLHAIDSLMMVEVIDIETGEPVRDGEYGELVITSLYNLDTPLVRCRIRDGGIYHDHSYCSCGRPFGGIEVGSLSRTDDVKKVKGVTIYPQAVDQAVLESTAVDEYEVLLTSADDATDVATVVLMLKKTVAEASVMTVCDEVAARLHRTVGIHFTVTVGEVSRSEYKVRRWRDERVR